jgi:DNA recombination protein RmuC
MGAALQKSVESYNALVGALETRVLVTARTMHDLELVETRLPEVRPIEQAPRPLTAAELLDALDEDVARPQLQLDGDTRRNVAAADAGRHTA